ncbi:MAG: imelysin family protein [Bacteroidetes bacterium]|nr:imelysin family protein [Bacteroidota bacterium]
MLLRISTLILASAFLLLGSACKNDDGDDNPITDCMSDFDQETMYENLVNQLIMPSYDNLLNQLALLEDQLDIFMPAPDAPKLEALQNQFIETWKSWQWAAAFEFGPAEENFLRSSLNNFPVDTQAVHANIQSGNWDFDLPDNYDKGFPAMDYLLFGSAANNASIADLFANSDAHRDYVQAVFQDMYNRTLATQTAWTDNYAATFIANTGTAAGTSLSLVVNNLNQFYEIIKRDQIGIPSGVVTLGFTNPDKVEAYYSGISLGLCKEALAANEAFYLGNNQNGDSGQGLDDFLRHIGALKNGQSLDQLIQDQYSLAKSALEALEAPLSETVDQNPEAVSEAYAELSRQVVQLKTDLPSALCVSITYIDNPSDSD